jgi:putrescine transport system ATP-binding protein
MALTAGARRQQHENNPEPKKVLLSIEKVTKYFDEDLAVDNVTLEVREGEIFALLGASGSGKSTLLRIMAGFESPTEGRILLAGEDITYQPPYQRQINMMFQSYALFPHMTVEQNLAFGLKQESLAKDVIIERVQRMLKLVHMEKFARRKPHQLSGGQQQRIALARSLAKQP